MNFHLSFPHRSLSFVNQGQTDRNGLCSLFLGACLSLALAASASGGTINLSDENSAAIIAPSSSAGLTSWTVNGQNYATQQSFWLAVGDGSQASIDSLPVTGSGAYFFVGGGTRGGYATYSGPDGLGIEVDYLLTGASGGQSNLSEMVRLTNSGTASQTYHFFQYSAFDLSHNQADTVTFPNTNTVMQTGGLAALEEAATPAPARWEGNTYPQLLNELNGPSYALSDTPSLGGSGVGPNDVTWAYEWSPTIAAGGSYIISLNQRLDTVSTVPEPGTSVLLAAAGLMLLVGWGSWKRG